MGGGVVGAIVPAMALPPPEDVPEEVLRTEIITEARSPVTGEPLTAAEYAELEEELQRNPELYSTLPSQLRYIITLLQLRRALRRTIFPFIP
ncbi:MAG: glutathione S-transferase [Cyanobacteria bacterium CRU_2_1]|nr:glutathione S-transferase [Cyanobacteria bacterium RU_5_0]NJR57904.1 glutathione S-transferase [Cyanobacteria bacterium CRU_2_1]